MMRNESNNTSVEESILSQILKDSLIKVADTYETPPQIIWVDNSTIATLGNFSASTGKAKAKKTFNVSAIVAASLANGKVLNYRAQLPEGKKRILYVDTEQSRYHCHKVLGRILRLAGLPPTDDCGKLDFICLREYSPSMRLQLIDYALKTNKGYGLVIIDGIRDLLLDINNAGESVEVINKMMEWSSRYNLHIHCVLHQNKGDNNVRGHIGTEMSNKAETVLVITKDQLQPDFSTVKAMTIREKDFKPFSFTVNDEGLPILAEKFVPSEQQPGRKMLKFDQLPMESHHKALEIAFENRDSIIGYNNMIDALTDAYQVVDYKRGKNVIGKLLKYLTDDICIVKHVDRAYYYGECPDTVTLFDNADRDE